MAFAVAQRSSLPPNGGWQPFVVDWSEQGLEPLECFDAESIEPLLSTAGESGDLFELEAVASWRQPVSNS